MIRPDWVITTCGGTKLDGPAPAAKLYCGYWAQRQMTAARALHPKHGHLILSNVHGYMRPSHIITRYNSHWGYPDTMPDEQLRAQVREHGIKPGHLVVCLGAREYADRCKRYFPAGVTIVWPPLVLPQPTLGYQDHQVKQLINHGLTPHLVNAARLT